MRVRRNNGSGYGLGCVVYLLCCLFTGIVWANDAETRTEDPNRSRAVEAPSAHPKSIAVLRIHGIISERPGMSMMSLVGDVSVTPIVELVDILKSAGTDDSISAVLLSIEDAQISWAQVEELRTALQRFRATGKKSYAYVETIGQLSYLLASECDEIAMTETGMLMLNGMSGRAVYFKNLFDTLGIQADFLQMGNYKGAAEPFTRTGPSTSEREQVHRVLDSLYDQLIESIALSRKLSRDQVKQCIDEGPYTAEEARAAGLIDRVEYRDEFLEYLKGQFGGSVSLRLEYGKPGAIPIRLDNPFGLMNMLQQWFAGPPEPPGDAIAVLYIDGPIMSGENGEMLFGGNVVGSRTIRMILARAMENDDIKAVVVRIDSPGGSATASDIIYHAIRQCAGSKPVVVSMGGVAASGGYYVACGAPHIIAQPTTITGSIGVVGGKLTFGGLLDKIGITTYGYRRGKNAQIFDTTRPFSPTERGRIRSMMQSVYETFKTRVTDSRNPDETIPRLKGSIEYLAQGKIYTGEQALQAGLVDQLGGLRDAIELAAEKANIEKYHIRSLPRPKTLLDVLEMLMAQADNQDDNRKANLAGLARLIPSVDFKVLNVVETYVVQTLLHRAYCIGSMLSKEPVLLIQPFEIVLDR